MVVYRETEVIVCCCVNEPDAISNTGLEINLESRSESVVVRICSVNKSIDGGGWSTCRGLNVELVGSLLGLSLALK